MKIAITAALLLASTVMASAAKIHRLTVTQPHKVFCPAGTHVVYDPHIGPVCEPD